MRWRAAAYRAGLLRSHRLARPVITVGNLTVGGTGKTPLTAWLANWLADRGRRVAILSRGYGGSREGEFHLVADQGRLLMTPAEAGDEPCLLAGLAPAALVAIGADRVAAGRRLIEEHRPDILLLDDGFQHLRLHRDLNILLLDCQRPFGNGLTLPAGLLREPADAIGRADLVVFTRCSSGSPPAQLLLAGLPWCRAEHRLSGYRDLAGGPRLSFAELAGRRGVAAAGIAVPGAFFSALAASGLDLVATLPLPDHCRYGIGELAALRELVAAKGAEYLLVTAKDAVKLGTGAGLPCPVYQADLELAFPDSRPLTGLLEKLL
jgi:tetraacyldisaccharide 4'-kinase